MNYNKSLPNNRLKSDEDKLNNYLEGVVKRSERQVSALQVIVQGVIDNLIRESKKEIPKDTWGIKDTFDTINNYCEFASHDLEVYFDFMCNVIHSMRDSVNNSKYDTPLNHYILDCEKTISALLTIITNSETLLDDEFTTNERCLKEGSDIAILIGSAQDTCRYCYDNLKVFCDLMDANIYNLQKLAKIE